MCVPALCVWYFKILYLQKSIFFLIKNDLQNMQWGDVQQKIVDVQEVYQMCIHKKDLTELGMVKLIRKNLKL